MPRKVSATEAKNRFGALIDWVREHRDEVIVESRGEPAVVIMAYGEYEAAQALREERRRTQALDQLRELRARVQARNADLAPAEGDALAELFSHELIDDLASQGKIRFEE